jgi:hypothetical protein
MLVVKRISSTDKTPSPSDELMDRMDYFGHEEKLDNCTWKEVSKEHLMQLWKHLLKQIRPVIEEAVTARARHIKLSGRSSTIQRSIRRVLPHPGGCEGRFYLVKKS